MSFNNSSFNTTNTQIYEILAYVNEMIGKDKEIFKLTFDSKYIMGYDPYNEDLNPISVGVTSKPKKEWGIKKIRGFKRVVELGWSYNVEILK